MNAVTVIDIVGSDEGILFSYVFKRALSLGSISLLSFQFIPYDAIYLAMAKDEPFIYCGNLENMYVRMTTSRLATTSLNMLHF